MKYLKQKTIKEPIKKEIMKLCGCCIRASFSHIRVHFVKVLNCLKASQSIHVAFWNVSRKLLCKFSFLSLKYFHDFLTIADKNSSHSTCKQCEKSFTQSSASFIAFFTAIFNTLFNSTKWTRLGRTSKGLWNCFWNRWRSRFPLAIGYWAHELVFYGHQLFA